MPVRGVERKEGGGVGEVNWSVTLVLGGMEAGMATGWTKPAST